MRMMLKMRIMALTRAGAGRDGRGPCACLAKPAEHAGPCGKHGAPVCFVSVARYRCIGRYTLSKHSHAH
jgi:hypothetical protein